MSGKPCLVAQALEDKQKETALVSYKINLDAWYSGDGVILLVSLRRADAHQSGTLISDMPHMPKLCSNVCLLRCDSYSL